MGIFDRIKSAGSDSGAERDESEERRDPPMAIITPYGRDKLSDMGALTDGEFVILNELSDRPMSCRELSRSLDKPREKVAAVLEQMERRGYISRRNPQAGGVV